jgi:GntR family transcriptional repressor for pyruvate dehydrogenase complex
MSVDETIVREIQSMIASGQLSPGDRLPAERDLARSFDVSRTSLREALRRLAEIGLVEIRWGQGVFVRSTDLDFVLARLAPVMLDRGNVAALYEMRRLLEVAAAGWAAERASAAEKADLVRLTAEAEASSCRLDSDAEHARDIDQRYHNLIAAVSGNPVMVRLMLSLLDLLAEVRQQSFAIPGRALESLAEHRRITDAIAAGDAAAARDAMLAHLKRAEAAVLTSGVSSVGSCAPPVL